MKWKSPHYTKIYEALGANADGRVEIVVRGKEIIGGIYSKDFGSNRQTFTKFAWQEKIASR
jgi:hypothetical protein